MGTGFEKGKRADKIECDSPKPSATVDGPPVRVERVERAGAEQSAIDPDELTGQFLAVV